jgi:hypothetical protein
MSATPAGVRRLPSPFAAMVGYAVRIAVPARRRWLLAIPVAVAVLLGLLAQASTGDPVTAFRAAAFAVFSLVLPLVCLVLGDAVLGSELRSGTFGLTWLSPVPHRALGAARWLAGWVLALAALVPAGTAMCLAAGQPGAAPAMALALVAGSAAYLAVFLLIGASTRRSAVWSVGFVLIVERLLGGALASVARLTPSWLSWAAFDELAVLEFPGHLALLVDRRDLPWGWPAIIRLALLALLGVTLTIWRLRHLELTGAED